MLNTESQKLNKQVAKLIARSWLSPEFQEEFLRDPKATLASNGVSLPEGVEVAIDSTSGSWEILISEQAEGAVYKLPLPPKPADISAEELQGWAEGTISERPHMVAKT